MTRAGASLDDVPARYSWRALKSFIENLDMDSALFRECEPEMSMWSQTAKTNAVLADIYDVINLLNANFVAFGSYKKANRPKLYPRPWRKEEGDRHYGKDAVTQEEFKDWIKKKAHGKHD